MKKILIICPYPTGEAPSQRFRFEQYTSQLIENGFKITTKPFLDPKGNQIFYHTGNFFSKISMLMVGYGTRLLTVFQAVKYDFIFIHREATPVGPPVIEWVLARVLKKKIIYDFDDAIWLTDNVNESSIQKFIRWRSKIRLICSWSYKISCGNSYLADYARQFNGNVFIVPTTIDTQTLHNPALFPKDEKHRIALGWTGSHSTVKYLEQIIQFLKIIETKFPTLEFIVIADKKPELPLRNLTFKKWSKETELYDLRQIDIGLMPLPDDEWTRGKCGFKALQYMAMEIPAVVSKVGVNSTIVETGVEGFCCQTETEWVEAIETLILDQQLRKMMGQKGRFRVINHFSIASNSANFLSLFE